MSLEDSLRRIDARVASRRGKVEAAIGEYLPALHALLPKWRETFGARIEWFASPDMNYGQRCPPGEVDVVVAPQIKWVKRGSKRSVDKAQYRTQT